MSEMSINWSEVEDVEDFSPVAPGRYAVQVVSVDDTRTLPAGEEIWELKLVTTKGERAGHQIRDSLFFTQKGLKRAKLVLSRLGVNLAKKTIKPSDLNGCTGVVDVLVEPYEARDGSTKMKNVVTYAGYYSAGSATGPAAAALSPPASKKTAPAVADLWNTSQRADNDEPPF